MEPRGVPAVQIIPLMSSVYRGRNDADRVEEVVSGPPADFAFLPVFLPVERSSSPAVTTVITPLVSQMRRFAFGVPRFLGTCSRTLWSDTFPVLFHHLQDGVKRWFWSFRFLLGLSLPATAVGESVDREPMGR